jgi:hypothetical protein
LDDKEPFDFAKIMTQVLTATPCRRVKREHAWSCTHADARRARCGPPGWHGR